MVELPQISSFPNDIQRGGWELILKIQRQIGI